MRLRVSSRCFSSPVSFTLVGLSSSRALAREEGQTLAEYVMILTLVALIVTAALLIVQGTIGDLFSKAESAL